MQSYLLPRLHVRHSFQFRTLNFFDIGHCKPLSLIQKDNPPPSYGIYNHTLRATGRMEKQAISSHLQRIA